MMLYWFILARAEGADLHQARSQVYLYGLIFAPGWPRC
jgi:hypothetical protein